MSHRARTDDGPDRSRAPAPGPLRPFHFPDIRRHRMGNGMEVVVSEARGLPVATLDLVVPGGGEGEPEDRGGLAALTAGLLESGAGARDAAQVAETADALGLSLETGAAWETAAAGFTSLRAHLDAGFGLLADLVRRPAFPPDEVQRIRDERLSGLAQQRADPGGLAEEMILRHVFAPGVPYGRRLGGLRATLESLTAADVRDFHARRYRPVGTTLVAAGDVSLEEVVALAERYFGEWEGAPEPVAALEPAPRYDRTTVVIADRPGAVQSEVRVGHPAPPRAAADHVPAQVLNAVLGGSFASRLNMNLRERLGYTYGVSSRFGARARFGTFTVSTAVESGATAHTVSEILREMHALREAQVTPAELDDARTFLAGSFPLGLQTTQGLALRLSTLVVYGLPEDYWDTYRERILAVTADDVIRAARARLRPDRAAVLVVGDAAAIRESLEALDAGPVEVVPAPEALEALG
jgi:zinc protease